MRFRPISFLPFILFLFFVAPVSGQKDYAKKILDTLCSPSFDGRGYVNEGSLRASQFLADELKKIGVVPFRSFTFFQDYGFDVNTFPGEMLVVLDDDTLVAGEEFLVDPNSGSAVGSFEIVQINTEVWKNKSEISPQLYERDKKVLLFDFTDITDPKAYAQMKDYVMRMLSFLPCIWIEKSKQNWSVGRYATEYPLITIDSADYHGARTVELNIENKFIPQCPSKNVIGVIPGKKKKLIVFSAHLDHLGRIGKNAYFPGANDNASGVAMLLSLAKYFVVNPPEYTIALCFFSGEEAGMEGSQYFVQHPFFKLKKIRFVINIDIMGGASEGITVVNGTEYPKEFDLMTQINEEKKLVKQIKKRGPTQNSDHYSFAQVGVPAFFIYSNGTVKNYHDVFDKAESTPLDNFEEVEKLLIEFVGRR